MSNREQAFDSEVHAGPKGRAIIRLPFDPDEVWGAKTVHHVAGHVDNKDVRAVIEAIDGAHMIAVGPAWRRDRHVAIGDRVSVVLAPEGAQREDLAPDLRAALELVPEAGAFFDGLPQFYVNAYMRWIDATKRSPENRARRIAEVVGLLQANVKERPQA